MSSLDRQRFKPSNGNGQGCELIRWRELKGRRSPHVIDMKPDLARADSGLKLAFAIPARIVEVRLRGGIVNTDRKNALIIYNGRLGCEKNMTGVMMFLNFWKPPGYDIPPAHVLQKIDLVPAAIRVRSQGT